MQTVDGFGFAMTGGSAELLMKMSAPARAAILHRLFGSGGDAIATSYLRLSIGASDMNERVFTYDDVPAGEQDVTLAHFDLGPDRKDVVPVMREVLRDQSEGEDSGVAVDGAFVDEDERERQGWEFEAGVLRGVCAVLRTVSRGDAGGGDCDRGDHGAERAGERQEHAEPGDDGGGAGYVHQGMRWGRRWRRRGSRRRSLRSITTAIIRSIRWRCSAMRRRRGMWMARDFICIWGRSMR